MLKFAVRPFVAGVAALAIALAFISGGTPASWSDPGPPGVRLIRSVFETFYSVIIEYPRPAGSHVPEVRLASLDTDFTLDTASAPNERQATAAVAATDRASFDERFESSFGERLSSFEERFGATWRAIRS